MGLAEFGRVIGHASREAILEALMGGKALSATELAYRAGISNQTASSHFNELVKANLLHRRKCGRFHYYENGISLGILNEVYKELYKRVYIDQQQNRFYIAPDRELSKLNQTEEGWNLEFSHLSNNCTENISADNVILSLGQTIQLPRLLGEVLMSLEISTTKFEINDDFSLKSEYLCKNKIYLQGMSKLANGIAEPNLGMSPWRNSIILNSIFGREVFPVPDIDRYMVWGNLEGIFTKCIQR